MPRWAQPGRDRGDAAGGQSVTVTVYLPLRSADAAQALVQQLSDPASASYGQYLSPGAFSQRFSPSDGDVAAVKSFLRGAGLDVADAAEDNRYVEATGTLAQAESAFDTRVHRFAYRGRVLQAPTQDLSVSSSLSGKVLAVTGLDQSGTLTRPQRNGDLPGASPAGVRQNAGRGVRAATRPRSSRAPTAPPAWSPGASTGAA